MYNNDLLYLDEQTITLLFGRQISSLKTALKNHFFLQETLNAIVLLLNTPIATTDNHLWEGTFPIYTRGDGLTFNIITGRLHSEKGYWRPVPLEWLATTAVYGHTTTPYSELFGKERVFGYWNQNRFDIQHAKYGYLTIYEAQDLSEMRIEKKIDSKRYFYLSPKQLANYIYKIKPITEIDTEKLRGIADYKSNVTAKDLLLTKFQDGKLTAWFCVEGSNTDPSQYGRLEDIPHFDILFIDWLSQRIRYKIFIQTSPDTLDPLSYTAIKIIRIDDTGTISYLANHFSDDSLPTCNLRSVLSAISLPKDILIWKDATQKNILSIEIALCLDEQKQPLEFIYGLDRKGKACLFWKTDPQFFVVESQKFQPIQGLSNFLLLQNKQGLQKVLLIEGLLQDTEKRVTFGLAADLGREKFSIDFSQSYQYRTYKLDSDRQLVAHDRRGKLFLSYLSLTKLDYENAYHYVKCLSYENELTTEEKSIFIELFRGTLTRTHPNELGLRVFLASLAVQFGIQNESYYVDILFVWKNYISKKRFIIPKIKQLISRELEIKVLEFLKFVLGKEKIYSNRLKSLEPYLEALYVSSPSKIFRVNGITASSLEHSNQPHLTHISTKIEFLTERLHINVSSLLETNPCKSLYWVNLPYTYLLKNFGRLYVNARNQEQVIEIIQLSNSCSMIRDYKWRDLGNKLLIFLKFAVLAPQEAPPLPVLTGDSLQDREKQAKEFFNALSIVAKDFFLKNPEKLQYAGTITTIPPLLTNDNGKLKKLFYKKIYYSREATFNLYPDTREEILNPQFLEIRALRQQVSLFHNENPLEQIAAACLKTRNSIQEVSFLPFFTDSELKSSEPIFEKELVNFQKDYQAGAIVEQNEQIFLIGSIKKIAQELKKIALDNEPLITRLKGEIIELLNTPPTKSEEKLIYSLQQLSKENPIFDFESAEDLFIQRSFNKELGSTIPLSKQQQDLFYYKMSLYLLAKTRLQQANKSLDLLLELKDISKASNAFTNYKATSQEIQIEYQNKLKLLKQQLCTKRSYHLDFSNSLHRIFLLLEARSELLLRPKQLSMIELMMSRSDKHQYSSLVVQLMMGEGKTKVIIPTLAQARADGDCLSLIIVPSALYPINKRDLRYISEQSFKQRARYIDENPAHDFSREGLHKLETLQHLLSFLKDIQKSKFYLITPPEFLQNIELAYIEALNAGNKDHVTILQEVLLLLRSKGNAIIDEVDHILDCRRELHYTFGSGYKISSEQQDLILCLYKVFMQNEYRNILKTYTDEQYCDLKKQLVDAVIAQIKLSEDEAEFFADIILNKNVTNQEKWPRFIKLMADRDTVKADLISLAKEEIESFLPNTLKTPLDVKYGISKLTSRPYAIPYLDNNRPDEKSDFANQFECFNYTIQFYISKGVSENQVIDLIKYEHLNAEKQAQINGISFTETTICSNFSNKYGCSLVDLSVKDKVAVTALQTKISENIDLLFDYLKNHVLPQIETYPDRISHYAANLVSSLASVQGVTGTPWNYTTFHQNLTPKLDIGTEGRVAYELVAVKGNSSVIELEQKDPSQVLKELKYKLEDDFEKLHAFIDVGALFKGISNHQVATSFAQFMHLYRQKIQGILFFDLEARQWCILAVQTMQLISLPDSGFKTISDRGFSPEQLFTYYDQANCTGTDIKQIEDAIGVMSIDTCIFRRDFFQGVFRMRQLLSHQNIKLITDKQSYQFIQHRLKLKNKLTCKDIIKFSLINQAYRLGEDNYRALIQKIHNIVRNFSLKTLLDSTDFTEAKRLFDLGFKELFITTQEIAPHKIYGRLTTYIDPFKILSGSPEGVKEQIINKFYRILHQCNWSGQIIEEKCNELSGLIENLLITPAKERKDLLQQVPFQDLNSLQLDTQVERLNLSMNEIQQQSLQSNLEQTYISNLSPGNNLAQYVEWLDLYNVYSNNLTEVVKNFYYLSSTVQRVLIQNDKNRTDALPSIYDKRILCSVNFLYTYHYRINLFSRQAKPIQYCLYTLNQSTGQIQAILLDYKEASTVKTQLNQDPIPSSISNQVAIFAIDGKPYYVGKRTNVKNILDHHAFPMLMMQIQHFSGRISYLRKKEIYQMFINWLRSDPAAENYKLKILECQSSQYELEAKIFKAFYEENKLLFDPQQEKSIIISEKI
ncbi:MAG: hypothetical protein K0S74_1846 [Chlamydiales bacterium]|nr:hypothetical protein [Chlamydiales bacterium]